jgi:hypothetical protein
VMAYYDKADKTASVAGADQTELVQGKQLLDDAIQSHQGGNIRTPLKG